MILFSTFISFHYVLYVGAIIYLRTKFEQLKTLAITRTSHTQTQAHKGQRSPKSHLLVVFVPQFTIPFSRRVKDKSFNSVPLSQSAACFKHSTASWQLYKTKICARHSLLPFVCLLCTCDIFLVFSTLLSHLLVLATLLSNTVFARSKTTEHCNRYFGKYVRILIWTKMKKSKTKMVHFKWLATMNLSNFIAHFDRAVMVDGVRSFWVYEMLNWELLLNKQEEQSVAHALVLVCMLDMVQFTANKQNIRSTGLHLNSIVLFWLYVCDSALPVVDHRLHTQVHCVSEMKELLSCISGRDHFIEFTSIQFIVSLKWRFCSKFSWK